MLMGMCWKIGNGKRILFWEDMWLANTSMKILGFGFSNIHIPPLFSFMLCEIIILSYNLNGQLLGWGFN